jgi:hypothetical protein
MFLVGNPVPCSVLGDYPSLEDRRTSFKTEGLGTGQDLSKWWVLFFLFLNQKTEFLQAFYRLSLAAFFLADFQPAIEANAHNHAAIVLILSACRDDWTELRFSSLNCASAR